MTPVPASGAAAPGQGVLPASGALVAGRYRLLDRLGAGGMSTVWRAYDGRGRRLVAVKVLAERHPTALLRLAQEQSLRLTHPHVVTATGWAADDRAAAVAMPLMRGGSVAELLARHGRLPAPLVAVLLDQLLAGLEAVHGAGIVHRDVKPANLLLAATGRGYPCLRLADFGVAVHAHLSRLTGESGVVGTDGYMPAEQAHGGRPAAWWDVYAAGVVARELLSGSPCGWGSEAASDAAAVEGGGLHVGAGVGVGCGATTGAASLHGVATALVSRRLGAAEGRALLAEAGVPEAARWPALGMPPVPDVVGPDPRALWWRAPSAPVAAGRDPSGGRGPAAMLVLALILSITALVVALTR